MSITILSGRKAVKLSDLVPQETKQRAAASLHIHWLRAKDVFSSMGDIGDCPYLDFNMRSSNIIGKAIFTSRTIQLNPVYLSSSDIKVVDNILYETVIHEIAHHVAWRLYKEPRHGQAWKDVMVNLGIPPNRLYLEELPDWAQVKQQRIETILGITIK